MTFNPLLPCAPNLRSEKPSAIFLDRDGVINVRIVGGYVLSPHEFRFIEEADRAVAQLSQWCDRLFVVTNQQCVAKGLLTEEELNAIHAGMAQRVEQLGGHIDRIYTSPHLASENHPDRKPNIGMALKAKDDFPEIDLSRSLMIGDSTSDLEFARRANLPSIYIGTTTPPPPYTPLGCFPTLMEAARRLMHV